MDPDALVRSMRKLITSRDPMDTLLLRQCLEDYDLWYRRGGFAPTEAAWA